MAHFDLDKTILVLFIYLLSSKSILNLGAYTIDPVQRLLFQSSFYFSALVRIYPTFLFKQVKLEDLLPQFLKSWLLLSFVSCGQCFQLWDYQTCDIVRLEAPGISS